MENQSVHADWAEGTPTSVTLEALDALVAEYVKAREVYEAAKKVSGEKYADYQALENKLVTTLSEAGKKSYKVDGVGAVTRVVKTSVQTPKDVNDKRAFFDWVEAQYGKDVRDTMSSVNSNTLNSFYNQEVEKHKDDPMFAIPGIGTPTASEHLSFKRDK